MKKLYLASALSFAFTLHCSDQSSALPKFTEEERIVFDITQALRVQLSDRDLNKLKIPQLQEYIIQKLQPENNPAFVCFIYLMELNNI